MKREHWTTEDPMPYEQFTSKVFLMKIRLEKMTNDETVYKYLKVVNGRKVELVDRKEDATKIAFPHDVRFYKFVNPPKGYCVFDYSIVDAD